MSRKESTKSRKETTKKRKETTKNLIKHSYGQTDRQINEVRALPLKWERIISTKWLDELYQLYGRGALVHRNAEERKQLWQRLDWNANVLVDDG
jgi:hypothetical protein